MLPIAYAPTFVYGDNYETIDGRLGGKQSKFLGVRGYCF